VKRAALKGPKLVALDGATLVGVIHWVMAPGCRLSGLEKIQLVPAMIRGFGVRSTSRVSRWLATWARHDPDEDHVHLGPLGVEPSLQGRGIGPQLMEHHCRHVDEIGWMGYLETDREENVAFYERFGFEVSSRIAVLGVQHYLMKRPPRPIRA